MSATNRDFISELDSAIGCQQCGRPLGDSPSDDFCTPDCQAAWSAARTAPLASYSEPDEQPAHVSNLVELHSPETCVACVEGRRRRDAIASALAAALTHGSSHVLVGVDPAGQPDDIAVLVPSRNARRLYLNGRAVGVTPDGEVVCRRADGRLAAVDHVVIQPYTARLDAALRQMGRAAELPEDWVERFTGFHLADWQRDILRDQYERWTDVVRRQSEQMARAATTFAPIIEQMGRAAADAVAALEPLAETLAPRKPPADRRARALWLRQNRNTGPASSARAPRSINPRRGR